MKNFFHPIITQQPTNQPTMTIAMYFYKGTAVMPNDYNLPMEDAMALGKEQVANGLRMSGLSLEEQTKDYFKQLDTVEQLYYEHCNPSTEEGFKKVCKIIGMPPDQVYALWCINICSLLVMKKLTNDDMNGVIAVAF